MGSMTYWMLNAGFLAGVAVIAVLAVAKARRRMPWVAVVITFGVVALLTAVFDNILIAVGIIAYDPALSSGILLGRAPIEDFSYALAAAVLLPSLWILLPPGRSARRPGIRTSGKPDVKSAGPG
jgi:lycopene cyclase domain-containing protein